MFRSWALPAGGYILVTGAIGVTARIALRTVAWPEILICTAIAYVCVAVCCFIWARPTLGLNEGTGMGLLTGFLAATGIIFLFVALGHGEVTRVVPVTSAYPIVTLILSVFFLRESLPATRVLGAVLVVIGVGLTAQ
jgi:transporter family protein